MNTQLVERSPGARIEYEDKDRLDFETLFSELVDGYMRTEFPLPSVNGVMYGPDGRRLVDVTQNGLDRAIEAVSNDPTMLFDVRRASIEQEEPGELEYMAKGMGPNTIIVPSDFPQELRNSPKDKGGYNVKRQQCMLRIYIRSASGEINMISQTLDKSDREGLEAIYEHFGMVPEEGELLGQRIKVDLSEADQATLADDLTYAYDNVLMAREGGVYYAGRRPADTRNTHDFVKRQKDIIDTCVRLKRLGEITDKFLYDAASTMQKRFAKEALLNNTVPFEITHYDPTELLVELQQDGNFSRRRGDDYSFCGGTLTAGGVEDLFNIFRLGDNGIDVEFSCTYKIKECPVCFEANIVVTDTHQEISGSCGCRKQK